MPSMKPSFLSLMHTERLFIMDEEHLYCRRGLRLPSSKEHRYEEVMRRFIREGAFLRAGNVEGDTTLLAGGNQFYAQVKPLLELGYAQDKHGQYHQRNQEAEAVQQQPPRISAHGIPRAHARSSVVQIRR